MNNVDKESTPNFLKRFWSALVKFGSPKLSVAAIRSKKSKLVLFEHDLGTDEAMCHANPST